MSNSTQPILTPDLTMPPITAAEETEAPKTAKWLKHLKLALSKRHNDIATAVATSTLAGKAADLPTPSTPGRLYYATDTHTLYGDDGTTWTVV